MKTGARFHGMFARHCIRLLAGTVRARCPAAVLFVWIANLPALAALLPPPITPPGGLVQSPALVTLTNPNPAGAIFYTLDGSDPCGHFGRVVINAHSYSDPISVNRSLIVRARVKSGTNWSELTAAAFTVDQDFSPLLFTEVMYHPRDLNDLAQFIELKNVGAVPLNLSGLECTAYEDTNQWHAPPPYFRFPTGTRLGPGEFLVLVNDTNVFHWFYPEARLDGEFSGQMSVSSMGLLIQNTNGARAATMFYNTHAPWPVVPDNHGYFPGDDLGFSLVRVNLDPVADPKDYRSWRASSFRYGSPGGDDPEPVVPLIYVNELLTRTSSGLRDTVEFFNPQPTNVSIGGWWLSDERNDPFRYQIPLGTTVPGLGFLVMDDRQFGSGSNGIAFSGEGERCYLFSADTNGMLTGYSHGLEFAGSDRDVTFGRYLASDGTEHFPSQLTRTLGDTNSGPRLSPVVISEVMYHPAGTNAEYVELCNTTDGPIALWDSQSPLATWAIGKDGPWNAVLTNTIIPPRGHLLFVQGDPAAFRITHEVPANVPVLSLAFRLSNGGEEFRLYRPSGVLQPGNVPRYVLVDEIFYKDRFPWPAEADGGGSSLERINLSSFGNDPANWRVCPAVISPGRPNSTNMAPQVWAGSRTTKFCNRTTRLEGAVTDDHWPGTSLTCWWAQVSGPASAELGSNTPCSSTVTFPQPGEYVLRLSASDGVYLVTEETVIDVIMPPFEAWRGTNFTLAELLDDSISGPAADPDGDGLNNLEEYFFGTTPKLSDTQRPLLVEVINDSLELSWTQRAEALDVSVTPEQAHRIEGRWFGGPGLFEQTGSPLDPGLQQVRLRSLLPVTECRVQFIRLRLGLSTVTQ